VVKSYSENESIERVYNTLKGINPNDAENFLGQMPKNEALARIAQLLENSSGEALLLNIPIYFSTGTFYKVFTVSLEVFNTGTFLAIKSTGIDAYSLEVRYTGTFSSLVVGSGTNTVFLNSDYGLLLNGNTTVWDDLRVPVTSLKTAGSKDPGFAVAFSTGGSQGVFTYFFDAATEEELYFALQIPHDYKLGTNLHPHVHWFPSSAGTGTVSWGLEYNIANITGTFGNTSIIYGNVATPNEVNLASKRHYLTEIGELNGSDILSVSTMLLCRLFRNATGVGGSGDSYPQDAGLLEVDFHYERDTLGSRTEYAK
jgi:hypothetical protein